MRVSYKVWHAAYNFSFILDMNTKLVQQLGVRPSLRRSPLLRSPIIDIPVGIIHKLYGTPSEDLLHKFHEARKRIRENHVPGQTP